jgi:hypothetical protein
MQTLVAVLIRIVLVAAGLVFAISLAAVATLVVALWGARYAWARLTGRPVAPFVLRMDRFGGFGRVVRGRWQGGAAPDPAATRPERRELGDVTDVEAKPPRAG